MKIRESKYILENGKPVPCPDVFKWGKWCEDRNNRLVASTYFDNKKIRVSTVFLAIDHSWTFDDTPPVLWETMVFGLRSEYMSQYDNVEDARKGHKKICSYVKRLLKRRKKK